MPFPLTQQFLPSTHQLICRLYVSITCYSKWKKTQDTVPLVSSQPSKTPQGWGICASSLENRRIASPSRCKSGPGLSPCHHFSCRSFKGLSLGMLSSSASPTSVEILVQKIILFKLNYVCHGVHSHGPKATLAGKQLLKLSLETHTFLIFFPK